MRPFLLFCLLGFSSQLVWGVSPAEYHSAQEANDAVVQASAQAAKLKEDYLARDQQCLDDFFVAPCRNTAKENYLRDKASLDAIQRQAERYLRDLKRQQWQERVNERQQNADLKNEAAPDNQIKFDQKQQDFQGRQQDTDASHTSPRPVKSPDPALKNDDDPGRRASNQAAYDQKQREARDYALQQEQRRQDAEAKRQQRIAERNAAIEREKSSLEASKP